MGPVVCATRGGEAGRRTQEQAVALAKERGTRLVFLGVFDPSFAGRLGRPLATAVEKEQQWLGRALLGTARARALREGVEASAVVVCGRVMEMIESYLLEVNASALVIGAPRVDSVHTFRPGAMREFAARVTEDTGVEVIVVVPSE